MQQCLTLGSRDTDRLLKTPLVNWYLIPIFLILDARAYLSQMLSSTTRVVGFLDVGKWQHEFFISKLQGERIDAGGFSPKSPLYSANSRFSCSSPWFEGFSRESCMPLRGVRRHGRYSRLFCLLFLKGWIRAESGNLQVHQSAKLHRRSQLVYLSPCHLGVQRLPSSRPVLCCSWMTGRSARFLISWVEMSLG